jgi:hypothetical protein
LIKTLDIIPNSQVAKLFDPSYYGQYFDGTHSGNPQSFAHSSHFIGTKILNEDIISLMIDNKPHVYFNEKNCLLVNLDIHFKNTKQFINV